MSRPIGFALAVLICSLTLVPAQPAGWRAGTASRVITPDRPLWMAGYAVRNRPSEGVGQDLHAKALALEDAEGTRVVLVTMDLLGFRSDWADQVAAKILRETGLTRDRILFNASHTHAGPALPRVLEVAYTLTAEQREEINAYSIRLSEAVVDAVLEALSRLEPCRLSSGRTEVKFAVNRRVPVPSGYVIGANRLGPVDHQVPFLAVDSESGQLKAVVFGYSCHNTTLQGENYLFHGDYAGVAQAWLEERHPGALAYFVTGTAGDANPSPRGTQALAEAHGAELARAVDRALNGPLNAVSGRIQTAFETVVLQFQNPPDREELERRVQGGDLYRKRHAAHYLARLDADGAISRDYPYPVQLWKLGPGFRLVALAGEVVVDYSRRLRMEFNDPGLWVAGYSNDVTAYIPSARVLAEGGYEAVDSMIFYGHPAPFEPSVEARIVDQVRSMMKRLEEGETAP